MQIGCKNIYTVHTIQHMHSIYNFTLSTQNLLQALSTIYLTDFALPRRSPKRLAGHLLVLFRQVVKTRSHRHVRQEQRAEATSSQITLELLGGEVVFVISRCQLILLPASCLAAVIAHCAALTIQGPGVGQQGPVRYWEAQDLNNRYNTIICR